MDFFLIMTSKLTTRSLSIHPPTTTIRMPTYKYEDAYYPNSNYPLGSLAPQGSYANPYPPGQGPNYQPPGSIGPAASTNTNVLEITSSPEIHTWSRLASNAASHRVHEVMSHFGSGNAPGSPQPQTTGRQVSSPTTTKQISLSTKTRQIPYPTHSLRPTLPLPATRDPQPTGIANGPRRHVHFSEDETLGVDRSPQQGRSGPALDLERSQTEIAGAAATDRQRNSTALQLARCGLPTQPSDMRAGLAIEKWRASSAVRPQQPLVQPPRPAYQTSRRAPAPTHQPTDREFAEETSRSIMAQLSAQLPGHQPGLRPTIEGTVQGLMPIDDNSSSDAYDIDDLELQRAERAQPWEPCDICGKKPHLVTDKRIKFCHSCYGESIAAEKALSRRGARKDGS
ncbi:hypothetical protein MMC18_008451 [Xylographa bjoerkii]|nr:hypothetical protein [Xylographa bjoerkii]